jgi:hypothetical protein
VLPVSTTVGADLLLVAVFWHLKDCFAQCMELTAFGATSGLSQHHVAIRLERCLAKVVVGSG